MGLISKLTVSECLLFPFSFITSSLATPAQAPRPPQSVYLLKAAQVFDGESIHPGWTVLVRGDRIDSVGPLADLKIPAEAKSIDLPGTTLMPGLIEAHSHVL